MIKLQKQPMLCLSHRLAWLLEQAEEQQDRQDLPVTSHLLHGGNDYERLDNIIVKQEAIEKVYSFLNKLRT